MEGNKGGKVMGWKGGKERGTKKGMEWGKDKWRRGERGGGTGDGNGGRKINSRRGNKVEQEKIKKKRKKRRMGRTKGVGEFLQMRKYEKADLKEKLDYFNGFSSLNYGTMKMELGKIRNRDWWVLREEGGWRMKEGRDGRGGGRDGRGGRREERVKEGAMLIIVKGHI